MTKINSLDQLAERLTSLLPASAQSVKKDIEGNLRTGLESGLRGMNLVTREEFDVQNAVLLRTREKIDVLEKKVAELEVMIKS
jgi:BMFP domain-containing protein YqiC